MPTEDALIEKNKIKRLKCSFVAVTFSAGAALICLFLSYLAKRLTETFLLPLVFVDSFDKILIFPLLLRYFLVGVLPIGIGITLLSFLINKLDLPIESSRASDIRVKNYIKTSVFIFGAGILGVYFTNLLLPLLSKTGMMFPSIISVTPTDVWSLFSMLIIGAILPAVLEEILYRGLVFRLLLPVGTIFAVIVSSLIFALSHMGPEQFLPAFFAGIVLSLSVFDTKRIWPAIFAHFMYNAVNIAMLYLENILPFSTFSTVSVCYIALCGIFSAVMLLCGVRRFLFLLKTKKPYSGEGAYYIFGAVLNPIFVTLIVIWVLRFPGGGQV